MDKVLTGLDLLREDYWKKLKGYRLGLLVNQASVDCRLTHAKDVISERLPGQLKALFGPQHGYAGEDQDNMIETEHSIDRDLGVPIFSLYGKDRAPLPDMLDLIDILLIDLQDVGTRVYTFSSTLLKAVSSSGKKMVVLDRPNPLGGEIIEGNLLKPDLYSFVGTYSLPMRHGLTMGEMAGIFKDVFHIEIDLEVFPTNGWSRGMLWLDTGLRWIMPSPNMPIQETAYVYPGQIIWEATNLSEGRGTCRPFEMFGAPFLDTGEVKKHLLREAQKGCHLQSISYRPTFHKWSGEKCNGFMIHILDHKAFRPFFTSVALLVSIITSHREDFRWKEPPYEYEYERSPIDLILGDKEIRYKIEGGEDLLQMREKWCSEIKDYDEWRKPYLLYK